MSEDLGSFDGTARLFPLPNVVLFPQVMLPLHIFEPRYRHMTADALAGDRLIALILLRPGWEAEHEARPPLYNFGCLGRITADQHLDDGRYHILLRGLSRARIVGELEQDKPYRSARIELVRDTPVADAELAQGLAEQLGRIVTTWVAGMGLDPSQLSKLFKGDLALGTISDVLSFALPLNIELKQELLEQLQVEQRVRRLLHYLETTEPPKPKESPARQFPPEFSSN